MIEVVVAVVVDLDVDVVVDTAVVGAVVGLECVVGAVVCLDAPVDDNEALAVHAVVVVEVWFGLPSVSSGV